MAINFPSAPTNGDQFTANNIVWTWDGSKWTVGAATSGVYMPIAGGTFTGAITAPSETLTGPLTGTSANFSGPVTGTTTAQFGGILTASQGIITTGISLDDPAGQARQITGLTSGSVRWQLMLGDTTAESGANAGSNLTVNRFTDAGVFVDSPLQIDRSNATASFSGPILSASYFCRAGIGGAITGQNKFNFFWTVAPALQAWINTTNVGNVTIVSDYRTKENVEPLPSAWDSVKALKPVSFTYKDYTPPGSDEKLTEESPDEHWGFIAHELQETLLPTAATGEKDSETHIQSPNWAPLVAALTKALQEAMARIEALEAA